MRKVPAALLVVFVLSATSKNAFGQQPPEWARGLVWYQILPDRFMNADAANNPTGTEIFDDPYVKWEVSPWEANWYNLTLPELLYSSSFYDNAFRRQYGGDIAGIISKLDYLKELGVEGILLNPIFESHSSHKFDIDSYHHIDRHLGPRVTADSVFLERENPNDPQSWYLTAADRAFVEMIHEIHKRGMKVIVDIHFAHVSVNFWAFRDVLKNQEKSAYASWFEVIEWDRPETPFISEFKYKAMWNVEAFPQFRQDTLGFVVGPKEYLYASTKRWMDPNNDGDASDGVDGWRVSLSQSVPSQFWNEWIRFVKAINPSALVIATGTSDPKTQFDFRDSDTFGRFTTGAFINGFIEPSTLDRNLIHTRAVDDRTQDMILNRISDHETARMASMCVNNTLGFDDEHSPRTNPAYHTRPPTQTERRLQQTILLFQFTYPGSPVIYYGDEAGMWGGDDPDSRKPMVWPEFSYESEHSSSVNGDETKYVVHFDSTVFQYYRQLIALRKELIALRVGEMKTLLLDDSMGLFGFLRQSGAQKVVVVFNTSRWTRECTISIPDIPDGCRIEEPIQKTYFYHSKNRITFQIPPKTGVILLPQY